MPCVDGPDPEVYSEVDLRHLDKALKEINKISRDLRIVVFKSLPQSLKLEYNYTNWSKNGRYKY